MYQAIRTAGLMLASFTEKLFEAGSKAKVIYIRLRNDPCQHTNNCDKISLHYNSKKSFK